MDRWSPTPLLEGNSIKLGLQASDFQTARHVAETINRRFGEGSARAMDGRTVDVLAPAGANERIAFIAAQASACLPFLYCATWSA